MSNSVSVKNGIALFYYLLFFATSCCIYFIGGSQFFSCVASFSFSFYLLFFFSGIEYCLKRVFLVFIVSYCQWILNRVNIYLPTQIKENNAAMWKGNVIIIDIFLHQQLWVRNATAFMFLIFFFFRYVVQNLTHNWLICIVIEEIGIIRNKMKQRSALWFDIFFIYYCSIVMYELYSNYF